MVTSGVKKLAFLDLPNFTALTTAASKLEKKLVAFSSFLVTQDLDEDLH